jgi:hypothetical protein
MINGQFGRRRNQAPLHPRENGTPSCHRDLLTSHETAASRGFSPGTADRQWTYARRPADQRRAKNRRREASR